MLVPLQQIVGLTFSCNGPHDAPPPRWRCAYLLAWRAIHH